MKKALVALFVVLLLIHATLLFYWGIAAFTTTVLFYILLYFILTAAIRKFSKAGKTVLYIKNLRVLFFFLLLLEFGLPYIYPSNNTFYERMYHIYCSPYMYKKQLFALQSLKHLPHNFSWENGYLPFSTSRHQSPDFDYPVHYNRLGLRGRMPVNTPDTNNFRVIVLGDSFVEGSGTGEDSTFPVLLEHYLQTPSKKIEVVNAGICGSNPLYAIQLYKNLFPGEHNNLVLLETNLTDIGDMEFALHADHPPVHEYFAAASKIFRALYYGTFQNDLTIKNPSSAAKQKRAEDLQTLKTRLFAFRQALAEKNCKLVIVYQPLEIELKDLEDDEPFLDPPTDVLRKGLQDSDLMVIDLAAVYSKKMQNNDQLIGKYYWPNDGHHTPAGYDLMAAEVAGQLKKNKLLPF